MRVVEAVDQVKVAGAAAARAYGELAAERRLACCREGAGLFVADVHPLDAALAAEGVGDAVEAVSDHPQMRFAPAVASVCAN